MVSGLSEGKIIESGEILRRNEFDLLGEVGVLNRDMFSARTNWNRIRLSKTIDDITAEDIAVRDDWKNKREKLITLLRSLSDDALPNLDLTPPLDPPSEVVVLEGAHPADLPDSDILGKVKIRPEDFDATVPFDNSGVTVNPERGSMAGRDHTNMTMEEIDYMIFNAKTTGKKPGIGPEGLSYWEEQKRLKQTAEDEAREKAEAEEKRMQAEIKAREEAEAKEARARELRDKISGLVTQLSQNRQRLNDEILPGLQVAKNTARSIDQAGWEDEKTKTENEIVSLVEQVKKLEKELGKLEKGMGREFKSALRSSFDKAKKKEEKNAEPMGVAGLGSEISPVSGAATENIVPSEINQEITDGRIKNKLKLAGSWIKERFKSILKDGGLVIGEVRQAEKLRTGTKYTAVNTEAMSSLIKTEWDIDNPDAVQEIVNEARRVETATGQDLKGAIETVSVDRKRENDNRKGYIIKTAIEELRTKLVDARGQATSETVLTPENLANVEAEMRMELNKVSDAALVRDVKGFAKVMRDNLDKYWWTRYLYGATELGVLGWLGYQWLNSETITLPDLTRPRLPIPDEIAPTEVSGDTRLMLDHYWGVAKNLWAEHGVSNPTNSQIMAVDKALALDNGVSVPEWGVEGDRLHTKLPVHWVLVRGGVAVIRASLGN